jgi:hypothetical protein
VNARVVFVGAVLATLGILGGCKGMLKKKGDDAAASASVAAAAPPAPVLTAPPPPTVEPTPPPVALDENAIPAPQDFEDEAFEKVTAANFRAEFVRLQKEVSQ